MLYRVGAFVSILIPGELIVANCLFLFLTYQIFEGLKLPQPSPAQPSPSPPPSNVASVECKNTGRHCNVCRVDYFFSTLDAEMLLLATEKFLRDHTIYDFLQEVS